MVSNGVHIPVMGVQISLPRMIIFFNGGGSNCFENPTKSKEIG